MNPTPELIDALSKLEAFYIFNPTGISDRRDIAFTMLGNAFEELLLHFPRRHRASDLEHPIRQRRLAMVDVGDDAVVADAIGVHPNNDISR